MKLSEIAQTLICHDYEVSVEGDRLTVSWNGEVIELLEIEDVFIGGNACFVRSVEDEIQYEITRSEGVWDMDLRMEVLEDRRKEIGEI